jgi:hypothetical protein
MGFQPQTCNRPRRATRQRSARRDCSVSSSVLPLGFIQRGVGLWTGTFEPAWFDRLSHTASILGELKRRRFTRGESTTERRRHRSRVWGLPTEARANRPVWSECTTNSFVIMTCKSFGNWRSVRPTSAEAQDGLLHGLKPVVSTSNFL